MNLPEVRSALHVDAASQRFRECADPIVQLEYDAERNILYSLTAASALGACSPPSGPAGGRPGPVFPDH